MSTGTPHGQLFVVAAPSGAGKTSLVRAVVERSADAEVTVSHTTRSRRPGEEDGVNYFFVDHDRFCAMRDQGEFVEWATVFGNYYGTSHAEIDRVTASGRHVILEIDWQGAQQIRQARPGARSIFILPPSMQTLHERLLQRAQDDHKTIARRMDEAISEMSHYAEFDYVIVNDDFETALGEIDRIIHGKIGQTELSPTRDALKPLIADLLPARPV